MNATQQCYTRARPEALFCAVPRYAAFPCPWPSVRRRDTPYTTPPSTPCMPLLAKCMRLSAKHAPPSKRCRSAAPKRAEPRRNAPRRLQQLREITYSSADSILFLEFSRYLQTCEISPTFPKIHIILGGITLHFPKLNRDIAQIFRITENTEPSKKASLSFFA